MHTCLRLLAGGILAAGLTSTSGCGPKVNTDKIIKIDGSSTVFPATEAVAEEFQKTGKAKVTVGISGTGGGFKKFCRGELDIADASRPISAEEMAAAKEQGIEYVELPICFDALTVVVNPQNDWVTSITVAELKKIWEPAAQDKITTWDQINPAWPKEKLVLFGAGSDSGTFDYFTEAVVGKAKESRGDYTGSEDDNTLVQGIEGNKYALGYLPYSYYEPNKAKLKALSIDWKADDTEGPVMPSLDAVLQGKYNPLSRPLFIYVNKKSATERSEVKEFVDFYLANAKQLVAEVNYLPLPDTAYEIGKQRFGKLQTGTAYGGVPAIGLPVEDVLKREPKS